MNEAAFIAGRRGGKTAALMSELLQKLVEQEAELATLRAENAHLKRALELVDALRNKERNLPL